MTYFFPDLEPVCCSVSSSNCCFLTCIQASQEAGQVVWCSHLTKGTSLAKTATTEGRSRADPAEACGGRERLCLRFRSRARAGSCPLPRRSPACLHPVGHGSPRRCPSSRLNRGRGLCTAVGSFCFKSTPPHPLRPSRFGRQAAEDSRLSTDGL